MNCKISLFVLIYNFVHTGYFWQTVPREKDRINMICDMVNIMVESSYCNLINHTMVLEFHRCRHSPVIYHIVQSS